jgi:beta-lactam-binding protein with PASTA domain/tRNA A-37 threonylcarbamoyl transferase component Bud32
MDTTLTDPLVGRLLDGRYRVDSRIARGGMAAVYLATDTRLDRRVAVKVMHPALADDAEFVARFIREARSAARLSHPNVVAVFDQGADGDAVFLVMEYVEGYTLRDLLRERGPLQPGAALAVLEPVLAALAAAHDAGLVHRDVKPENVLLADDGRVKVADFGLARAVAEASHTASTGLLIGTVAYLAPEQVEHGTADARSDVYAAGVMLFELLTGRQPFFGETAIAVAYRHVNDVVPAPSTCAPGIPERVDALVTRATSRDPDRRPADASAFLVALVGVRDFLGYRDVLPRLGTAGPGRGPGSGPGGPATLSGGRHTPDGPATLSGREGSGTSVLGSGTAVIGRDPAVPEAPEQPRRRRRWLYALLAVLLVLAAAAAGLAGWWFGSGRYVGTPGLLDLTYAQAQARTLHDDLHLRAGPARYSDTVPKGEVLAQQPGPERSVRRGSTVTVELSLGVLTRAVPAVHGETVAAATATLARATLVVGGRRSVYSSSVGSGLVISTDPPAGRVLRHGSAVTLIVSAGPQPVSVPGVDGEPVATAEQALSSAGLGYRLASAVYSTTVPRGDVVSQTPGPGSTLSIGSTVTLTPSLGPELFAVPNVTYQSVGAASATLRAAGFAVQVEQLPGGPGIVLKQSPPAGSMRRHGTTVTLYVF